MGFARTALARLHAALKRESWRNAARLGLQSAVASAVALVCLGWLGFEEKFVGVLSAALVVQPSVGNTLLAAKSRTVATIVGSLVGLACLVALPPAGPIWTPVAVGVSTLVVGAIAGLKPSWQYGVVAAIALSLGAETDVLSTAGWRAASIALGSVVGTLTALVVWPERAGSRARRFGNKALLAASRRLGEAVRGAIEAGETDTEVAREAKATFHESIGKARTAADAIFLGEGDGDVEQARNAAIERLYNSALIVHRVAEATDEAGSGGVDVADQVSSIRSRACELAETIARDRAEQDDAAAALSGLRSAVQDVRAAVADSTSEGDEMTYEHALVFGLSEITDALRTLVDGGHTGALDPENDDA